MNFSFFHSPFLCLLQAGGAFAVWCWQQIERKKIEQEALWKTVCIQARR